MKNLFELISAYILIVIINGICPQRIVPSDIVLFDKKFETESFYYDLSYVNSNSKSYVNVRDRRGSFKASNSCDHIRKLPSNIRREFKISYFYQKYTEAYGIPVIGSNHVNSNGMKRACYVLKFYLANNDILKKAFYRKKVRVVLMSNSENILRFPEFKRLPHSWEATNGLSATKSIPIIIVNSDNIECVNDEINKPDYLFHQISYSVVSIDALSKSKLKELRSLYEKAKANALPWNSSFALSDIKEYLATGIDVYYNATRVKYFNLNDLKKYDNSLVKFIEELMPCNYEYLNKCDSNRETENVQELGSDCKSARLIELTTTTTTTTTQRSTTTSTTTTTTTSTTTTSTTTSLPISTSDNTLLTTREEYIFKPLNFVQTRRPTTTTSTTTRLATTSTSTTTTSKEVEEDLCKDDNEYCANWASRGQCVRNSQFMQLECKRSCGLCGDGQMQTTSARATTTTSFFDISMFLELCKDEFTHCPVFALRGDCKTNPHHMLDKCKRSCNLCGDLVDQKDRIKVTTKKAHLRRPVVTYEPANTHATNEKEIDVSDDKDDKDDKEDKEDRDDRDDKDDSDDSEDTEFEDYDDESCKDKATHCPELAKRGDCETNKPTMTYYCAMSCDLC